MVSIAVAYSVAETAFPMDTKRYLFLGNRGIVRPGPYGRFKRWRDISDDIFGGLD